MTALECGTRVLTDAGWFVASELSAGQQVLCLHGDGHLRLTGIRSIAPPVEREAVWILTEVGDVVVPAFEPVLTAGGPVRASELSAMSVRGAVKMEVVQPDSIATFAPSPATDPRKAADLALSWLDRRWAAVPADLSSDRLALLVSLIEASGLPTKMSADARWFAWSWSPLTCADRKVRPSAEALQLLTAWTDTHSRTTKNERMTRGALLMAMTCDGIQPKVVWVPGYAPVECRISVQPSAMPYAKLVATCDVRTDVVALELERTGAVVASQLAVGRLG